MALEGRPRVSLIAIPKLPLIGNPITGTAPHVGHIQIRTSIQIGIAPGRRHTRRNILHTDLRRHITKTRQRQRLGAQRFRRRRLKRVQRVAPKIIGHIQIRIPVALHILPGRRQRKSPVVFIQPHQPRHIRPPPSQIIAVQNITTPVGRIMIRHRTGQKPLVHRTRPAGVTRHIQINIAVGIHIRRRQRIRHALGNQTRRPYRKHTPSIIRHKKHPPIHRHRQILIAIVIEIDKYRRLRLIPPIDPGRRRCIAQSAIRLLQEQAVGQATGLGHIQILPTIAISIPHGDAFPPGRAKGKPLFDAIQPVVEPRRQLVAPHWFGSKQGWSVLGESGRGGGQRTFRMRAQLDAGQARRFPGGPQSPVAQPFGDLLPRVCRIRSGHFHPHHGRGLRAVGMDAENFELHGCWKFSGCTGSGPQCFAQSRPASRERAGPAGHTPHGERTVLPCLRRRGRVQRRRLAVGFRDGRERVVAQPVGLQHQRRQLLELPARRLIQMLSLPSVRLRLHRQVIVHQSYLLERKRRRARPDGPRRSRHRWSAVLHSRQRWRRGRRHR